MCYDIDDATRDELLEYIDEYDINITVTDDMDVIELREAIQKKQTTTEKKEEILDEVFNRVTQLYQGICTNVYEMGLEFCKARDVLQHGEFMKWFESKKFPYKYTKAYNCMRVYLTCIDHPEAVQNIKKNILYRLSSVSFPKLLSEAIIKNSEAVIDIDGKNLKKLRDDFVSGKIDLKSARVQRLFHYGSYSERKFQDDMEEDFLQLSKIKTKINEMIERFNARCKGHKKYASDHKEKITELFEEIKTDLENF